MQKHKLLAFIGALLVSIALWFYAVTVVNPNDTTRISGVKVRFIGTTDLENNGLILTGGLTQYIDVEVSGRRSDLKELNSSSLEAIADVSNIDRAGTYEVSWTLDPPSTVASGDISLVSANLNKINVKVSEYNERPEIPITVEYEGELSSGFVRDKESLNQEYLSVSGPVEEISQIAQAVVTVNLDGVSESISEDLSYRLVDSEGQTLTMSEFVTVSSPTVRVSVPVLRYKQVKLRVNLIAGGGATADDVVCEVEPDTIGVTGSEEALRGLDELVIREIDLANVTESREWMVTPELPAGVTNRAVESSVKISLTFSGVTTHSYSIPCSSIERINDNSLLTFGEQSVVIRLRGKASALAAIKEEDIRLVANMRDDYDPTTKTVTLHVNLPSGTTAGVIGGPYTVQIIEVVPEEGE